MRLSKEGQEEQGQNQLSPRAPAVWKARADEKEEQMKNLKDWDLSSQRQHQLPNWVVLEGGWLVFAKSPGEDKWTMYWPTAADEGPEGIIRDKAVATTLARALAEAGAQVSLCRIAQQARSPI